MKHVFVEPQVAVVGASECALVARYLLAGMSGQKVSLKGHLRGECLLTNGAEVLIVFLLLSNVVVLSGNVILLVD